MTCKKQKLWKNAQVPCDADILRFVRDLRSDLRNTTDILRDPRAMR